MPYAEVIGDPVAHSKSPLIHDYWLRRLGIAGDYRRTRVAASELSDFLRQRHADPEWRGCNVTVPHKEAVAAHLDRLDNGAAAVGAVNCIVSGPNGLTGYNSDVDGVAAALEGVPVEGRKVALIGAGGAARAALYYLAERGVAEITILARSSGKAAALRSLVPNISLNVGPPEDAQALFAGSSLVINASPLGMDGCSPMPDSLLAALHELSGATLFDMVYSPPETAFLKAGHRDRLNGLTMLVAQAARAFELFFGTAAPPADEGLFECLATHAERASNSTSS